MRRSSLARATPDDEEDSTALAIRAAGADHAAFAALYRRHAPEVYGMCLRLTGDTARAGELVQDIFVRVWEQLHRFRGGSFGAWLHTVGRNHVLNDSRALATMRRRLASGDDTDAADARDPRVLVSQETLLTIDHAVQSLPPGARAVFLMHDVEGFSTQETAEALGIAPSTVRVQLYRARRAIAAVLRT